VSHRPPQAEGRPRAVQSVEVALVDVFTSTPFAGNPAAVVPDATGLDDAAMRAVAGEMGRPATAFVWPATADGERALRWFSPTGVELTLCGHGTVAAALVLAARGEVPGGRLAFAAPHHRLSVALEGTGPSASAWFEPECPRWTPEAADLAPILDALGLPAGAVAAWAPAARTVEADLLLPVTGLSALASLAPDLGRLGPVATALGIRSVFLTARETREPGALTHSRMFAPHIGIPEDPATGSTHAAVGVWLWETGVLRSDDGVARFRAEQGDFRGRPGRLAVEVHGAHGRAARVRIGGQSVIVLTGTLRLP
jgi:PhzF family phenazine biosynthesis protein